MRKGQGFEVHGVELAWTPESELYGEGVGQRGGPEDLPLRSLVKAVGRECVDGRLVVERLKVYRSDAEGDFELRGPLIDVDVASDRICLGGIWVRVDEETKIKLPRSLTRMDREDASDFVRALPDARADMRVSWRTYDLSKDPLEQSPGEDPSSALTKAMDALSQLLASHRIWGQADRTRLSPEEEAALRAIGYTE